MKQKVTDHFKSKWSYYVGALLVCMLIGVAFSICFRIWNMDLQTPLSYAGGDEMSMLVNAKMLEHQNWVLDTNRLGAPFGTNLTDFSANMMHNVGLIVMKLFVAITGNGVAASNLTFISIFFMSGLISYFVMLELKISNWVSVVTSAVFGFSPFMIMRSLGHVVLTEAYFVPLSILLCIWIYERDDIFRFDKNFFKVPRNYFAILFMLLIANNGIAYYPFFTCFILVATGISKAVKDGKLRSILPSLKFIAGICFFVVLTLVPHFIYVLQNGTNDAVGVRAGFVESEMYGLKIIQLLLPVDSHNIEIVGKAITEYNTNSIYVNENITSYIGLAGIIGFIILMFGLFMKRKNAITQRLGNLAELNIMLILLGTTGGFGTIFAFIVTSKIRSYNRISIFIAYVCILAFALALDDIYRRIKEKNGKAYKRYIVIVAGSLFCVLSMFEGFPRGYTPDYETNMYNFNSDDQFVKQIESMVSDEAMIYQLPYHVYPEGGSENNMWDYHLFTGFIHSDKLRWSYGSVHGRDNDLWNEETSLLPYSEMVGRLKESGFEGIYIDRRAFSVEDLNSMEKQLEEETGSSPIISQNMNLSFFKF